MLRRAPIVLAGLAVAGAAWAAGGPGYGTTTQSVFSPDGRLLYQADVHSGRTTVSIERNARTVRTVKIKGAYGWPVPTNDGNAEGVSHDGGTLVLEQANGFGRFAALDARTLRVRRLVALRGQFTYDALSPNGRMLYLIQHLPSNSVDRYYVRAYDLAAGVLLKQIVFDAREKAGPMSGWAMTRATGPTGRWVYTLYSRSNGSLFVHALDTVDRHAYCIDLPWRGSRMQLKLKPGRLVVLKGTKALGAIDTRTLRLRRS